ncbi:hypothetical protein ACHAW5_009179 [Stephanodiscus triporus]|uniref:Importin subunit alpha n=1 Tax=Stephanodiscus triporus TaxID=2934178 RepID=A0ABD3QAK1_9STRA
MPTFATEPGGDDAPPRRRARVDDEEESVRELNRLLEAALRMGWDNGGGGVDASAYLFDAGATSSSPAMMGDFSGGGGGGGGGGLSILNLSSTEAASWRLDTARRLGSLLSSLNPKDIDRAGDVLLPTLRRQSRYWIPLLLGWLRGGGGGGGNDSSSSYYDNSLDLPLTSKQRRQQRQKESQSSSSSSSSPPEVQIEALRALAALTEWTSRGGATTTATTQTTDGGRGASAPRGETSDDASRGGGGGCCSPHSPLSASSQRLLLRHADAVPTMVSLLSSEDAAVREQAMWMLGSIASGGLGAASLPPVPTPPPAAAAAAAATTTTTTGAERCSSPSAAATPAAAVAALSESTAATAVAGGGAGDPQDDAPSSSTRGGGKDKSSASARDVLFAAGAVAPILRCLADNAGDVPLHRVGAWCLSGLVEGRYSTSSSSSSGDKDSSSLRRNPSAAEEIDVTTLLPTVRRMLHMDDAEVLTFACWTLSHFCDGPAYHIAAVIYSETSVARPGSRMSPDDGLVPRLVELLLHPSPKVAKPALRTIGNIVCADCTDQQDQYGNTLPAVDFTEIILECRAVPCLRQLVEHHNREIQKEACWTLSNIAAGTVSQIQAVIDSGAIPPLVDIVNNELTDKEVRSEACWVVLNATSCGNDEQISILIQQGCVSVLGVLLTEANMVMMALEGIERVLQTEEAQDSEDLYHKSEEELGQRPTIIKCAALIKTVTESPHISTAVSKRAKRIWDHHFISCALCHNNYSRCRLIDSHFCNECKCHVCSRCDCRVYHLSYQEELWAEDEEKAAASKNQKKSKKQKKKQKMKEKAEKKKLDTQTVVQQQQPKAMVCTLAPKEDRESSSKETGPAETNNSNEPGKDVSSLEKCKPVKGATTTRKTTSSSPSRGTIESDTASLGAADSGGDCPGPLHESSDANNGQPPIDLVLYLQQTGSIIALAKLLDSLYDNEFEDEDDVDVGRERQQKTIDLNLRVQTTQ